MVLQNVNQARNVHRQFLLGKKENFFLFNDTLNTFYLQLYGVLHMVKENSDSERGNQLPPHVLLLPNSSKGSFIICIIPDRITHTKAFATPVVKEGNVLFNDTLNTFYLQLYGVLHMVKENSEREETCCRHICYSFRIVARVILLYASSPDRKTHNKAFATPVVKHWLEREIGQPYTNDLTIIINYLVCPHPPSPY